MEDIKLSRCANCKGAALPGADVCSKCQESVTSAADDSCLDLYEARVSLLLSTPDFNQAQMIERRLETLGIPCYISSSALTGVYGEYETLLGESRLYVPEPFWKSACQALRAEFIPC